jgi:cytochrome c oxidase subunit 4
MAHAHPIHPVALYIKVWFALMVLLLVTVLAVEMDLDARVFPGANITLAMIIAVIKAMIVVLWFMHLKEASRLVWVFAGASFIWFGVMVTFTYQDYGTRGWTAGGWESPVNESYTPAHTQLTDLQAIHPPGTQSPAGEGPDSGTMQPK